MRLVGLFVFLVAFAVRAQSGNNVDVFDPFFRYVEPRGRPSALPTQDESVDLFTGTLRINVVEFAFPGVAGLDLKLVRSYSSRIWSRVDGVTGAFTGDLEKSSLGIGWSMHFGRLRNPGASGQLQACGGGDYPVFEDGDGSARVFYPVGTDFISRDSWKMVRGCVLTGGGTGVCITDTQGRVREFSGSDQYSVGLSIVYPMSRIRDVHGNAIAATYNSGGKLNTISDTAQRTITFNYFNGSGCPTGGCLDFIEARKGSDARRVTYAYRVVTGAETYGPGRYLLQGPKAFLMRATPLVGPSLTYEYSSLRNLDVEHPINTA